MLDVRLGETQRFENLTLFPLVATSPADLPYVLLADALGSGSVRISEIGEGTVPTLLATNEGVLDVLILDGEQLIGSKQNRMTNRSILLPAGSRTEIPVYCMEQGRWHFATGQMASAPQHSPSKVRRRARETEARHAAAGAAPGAGVLREAQGDVWHDVADSLSMLKAATPTSALDAAYDANRHRLDEWLQAFPPSPDQVGLLAFVAEAPLGLDVVGAPRLYARLHDRLLRGYVLDALEHAARGRRASRLAGDPLAQRYLDAVRTAQRDRAPTVGRGEYHVIRGAVVGGELTDDGRIAHLSAFPVEQPRPGSGAAAADGPVGPPVAPPSRRRRRPPPGGDTA
ncbi:MAG TPA: DUF6569 family protein [Longimicrobiales bacterium]|nr:DUF6569 family protein [Longimicrobiales bacterium]